MYPSVRDMESVSFRSENKQRPISRAAPSPRKNQPVDDVGTNERRLLHSRNRCSSLLVKSTKAVFVFVVFVQFIFIVWLNTSNLLLLPSTHIAAPHQPNATAFLFMSGMQNKMEYARAASLLRLFPNSFHLVITPELYLARSIPLLPASRLINTSDEASISGSQLWSNICCAQEAALHWSLNHRAEYSHFWFMEGDVYFQNDKEFGVFINAIDEGYKKIDLVHQNDGMVDSPMSMNDIEVFKAEKGRSPWWYRKLYQPKHVTKTARIKPPYYRGMYQLYRLSVKFLDRLERFYIDNDEYWVFFEPLISTLAGQKTGGLSQLSFMDLARKGKVNGDKRLMFGENVLMQWRPCLTKKNISSFGGRGIFHPVKGDFTECQEENRFVDVID